VLVVWDYDSPARSLTIVEPDGDETWARFTDEGRLIEMSRRAS
jgi:hypothetical protein